MRRVFLALAAVAMVGCGGHSASSVATPARFAGSYAGPWETTDDASDKGTASWTFAADGAVTGQEFGPDGEVSGSIAGRIDAMGNLTSVLTEETEASAFNGALQLDGAGNLTGILVWVGPPAIPYRYSLTRVSR